MAINPASCSIPGASHHVAVSPNTAPECDATVQSHSGSSVSHRRHSYSRRDLLDIRSSNTTPILRHVRKALFQSFLWSPQTPSPAGIDSSSPRDCDADLVPHPHVGRREPGLSRESITAETYQIGLINSHIRHSRAGRALLRWRKVCGRLWVQLTSAVQAPMHSVAYMYIDSY